MVSAGDYVVTQSNSWGMVNIVGQDGKLVRSYKGSPPSGTKMKYPRGMAVTKSGDFLVADTLNNRILKLDSTLTDGEELQLSGAGQLQQPCVLCLDETRDRLYVGEIRAKSRLIVFNNLSRIYPITGVEARDHFHFPRIPPDSSVRPRRILPVRARPRE